MGTYRCEKADSESVVLRHEGENDHTIELHAGVAGAAGSGAFAPVPIWLLGKFAKDKRYTVSVSVTEYITYPAPPTEPAAVPAWAVKPEPERQIPSAIEPGQVDQLASSDEPDGGEQPFEESDGQGGSEPDSEPSAPSQAAAEGDEATAQ